VRVVAACTTVALAACQPVGARDVTGPARPQPSAPLPARIVAAERSTVGAHLVFVDESGQRVADLTDPPAEPSVDIMPAFSPDGRWVAFASSRGRAGADATSLWLVPADRSRPPAAVTDDAGVDSYPAFSPDGKRIAFASTRGGHGLDIWVVAVDGGRAAEAPRRLTADAGDDIAPAWSHAGDAIAYASMSARRAEIRVMRADGGGGHRVTDGSDPTFSPDDRSIVFSARPEGANDSDIHIINVDGSRRRLVLRDEFCDDGAPRFSSDGRFLFATAVIRRDDGRAVFAMPIVLDMTASTRTFHALVDRLPAARLGVAIAPGDLDGAALMANPEVRETIGRVLFH